MKNNKLNTAIRFLVGAFVLALASAVQAVVIDFTGGTVTRPDATTGKPSTETTNNSAIWDNVDYYEENGFRLDFITNGGSAGFSTQVGDYYQVGDDVIHADSNPLAGSPPACVFEVRMR